MRTLMIGRFFLYIIETETKWVRAMNRKRTEESKSIVFFQKTECSKLRGRRATLPYMRIASDEDKTGYGSVGCSAM